MAGCGHRQLGDLQLPSFKRHLDNGNLTLAQEQNSDTLVVSIRQRWEEGIAAPPHLQRGNHLCKTVSALQHLDWQQVNPNNCSLVGSSATQLQAVSHMG